MHPYIYILLSFFFVCQLSAQETKKTYSETLQDLIKVEEEYQNATEVNQSKRILKNNPNEVQQLERVQQLETLHAQGDDIVNRIYDDKQLQDLLNETQTIELPPLATFLNAAYENATIKSQEASMDQKMIEYKIAKRQWLYYFRINAAYSYGVFSALSNSETIDTPNFQAYSGSAQHTYNMGAGVSISLGDLFTQGQKMKAQKAIMRQAQYQYDEAVEHRKLTILNAYNLVVEQLSTIKAKAEAAAMYDAQMKISEGEFVNGQMSLTALSLERSRRSGALVSFQECKVQLHNAITLLELLTNIKILNEEK